MLYKLILIVRMKYNSILLNIARDSEFLEQVFKLNQSLKVKEKKRILQKICPTW